MNRQSVEEFKTEGSIELINDFMNANNGYITSKQVTDLGIHRMYLKIMLERNMIKRVFNGVYMNNLVLEDKYYIFQLKYPKTIFSGFTSLYFWGLTDILFDSFDITVDYDYHVNSFDKRYNVRRCRKDLINIGLVRIKTLFGNYINMYDKERSICDIIKNKMDDNSLDEIFKKYMVDKDKNLNVLRDYAQKLNIYDKVVYYIGKYAE